jgi:hypothetical protein
MRSVGSSSRPPDPMAPTPIPPVLWEVLEESARLGFLGPGPIQHQFDVVVPMLALVPGTAARGVDLGAGGGVPGLVLAAMGAPMKWVLVDRRQSRCDFLRRMVHRLKLEDVEICCADASGLGHASAYRGSFQVVVARGFGPPASTLECAAALLEVGGTAVITARDDDAQWPGDPDLLLALGMSSPSLPLPGVRTLRQEALCPSRYPRRGLPTS